MVAIFITLLFLLAILAWLMLSTVVLTVDTRVPIVKLNWRSIGSVALWYEENEWILRFRVLFYSKQMLIKDIKAKPAKKKTAPKKKSEKKKTDIKVLLNKGIHVLKSFRVVEYRAALDTGDWCYNALLYPLNYLAPGTHCLINFNGDSWLAVKISNNAFRALFAWLK